MRLAHLSREQLCALLKAAHAKNTRHWLMFLVGYWHGLRVSEITSLTAGQVRDGYITVQRLKGSLKTTQALVEHEDEILNEKAALTAWCAGKPSHQLLFPIKRQSIDEAFRRYGAECGIPVQLCHMHALKHSLAMHSLETVGIEHVRVRLGHKSLASTGEYLKVTDQQADAAFAGFARKEKSDGNSNGDSASKGHSAGRS